MGLSELLRKTNLDEIQKNYVDAIINSSDNLLVIINDILDLSKITEGKLQIEKIEFRLDKLVHGIVKFLELKAKDKGIDLRMRIDKNISPVLLGDPVRVNQVLIAYRQIQGSAREAQSGRHDAAIVGFWRCRDAEDDGNDPQRVGRRTHTRRFAVVSRTSRAQRARPTPLCLSGTKTGHKTTPEAGKFLAIQAGGEGAVPPPPGTGLIPAILAKWVAKVRGTGPVPCWKVRGKRRVPSAP